MPVTAIAALALEFLRVSSSILALVRKVSENDEILAAIVAEAQRQGRPVGGEEMRTAIADMNVAGERLAAKLGAVTP